MNDVVCIGEALVDFLPQETGRQVRDVETWTRCPGGSPSNVAIALARLGAKSAFLGVVGDDEFGLFLARSLAEEGVDISHLRMTVEGKTGLVFISLSDTGERTFSFYRTRAAEFFLDERDADEAFVSSAKAIHCGTNSLIWKPAQRAVVKLATAMRAQNKLVCSDPNLRLHVWPDPKELKELLAALLPQCVIVKLAQDEIEFVTEKSNVDDALVALRKMGVVFPVITQGAEGASFFWQSRVVRVPAPAAKVVDTTGAGDGFTAALLFGMTKLYSGMEALSQANIGELRELVAFACAVGARVTEKVGAVSGLPRIDELGEAVPKRLTATPGSEG